jgi:hypothetical protein
MTRSSWYWRDSGEALQQRWRRVASTHCLSDLAQDEGADTLQRSMGTALLGYDDSPCCSFLVFL